MSIHCCYCSYSAGRRAGMNFISKSVPNHRQLADLEIMRCKRGEMNARCGYERVKSISYSQPTSLSHYMYVRVLRSPTAKYESLNNVCRSHWATSSSPSTGIGECRDSCRTKSALKFFPKHHVCSVLSLPSAFGMYVKSMWRVHGSFFIFHTHPSLILGGQNFRVDGWVRGSVFAASSPGEPVRAIDH